MNNKLSVDQVRKCLLVVYYEGYNDGYLNRGCHYEETDWQAITDELNSQIEITEHEWISTECAKCGARENERDSDFKELESKVDELTNERYRYKFQCERYETRIDKLESLVRMMDRDCRNCHFSCYTEKGNCGIITLIDEALG